jgi:acetyltransferase-like isoleucine patch superfamily enzyme
MIDNLEKLKNDNIVSIGEGTYGDPIVKYYEYGEKLYIGKYCSIAENVTFILGGEHYLNGQTNFPIHTLFVGEKQYYRKKGDIIIGNDVWIGYGAIILSGVEIGDGSVIGAGSVISKNVEKYTVVVGNPQKIVRKRVTDGKKWWEWPIDEIRNKFNYLINKYE